MPFLIKRFLGDPRGASKSTPSMFSEAESAAKEKMCRVGDKGTTARRAGKGHLGRLCSSASSPVRDGA